jgi:YidC/Oxa1 family membrane protein insertase
MNDERKTAYAVLICITIVIVYTQLVLLKYKYPQQSTAQQTSIPSNNQVNSPLEVPLPQSAEIVKPLLNDAQKGEASQATQPPLLQDPAREVKGEATKKTGTSDVSELAIAQNGSVLIETRYVKASVTLLGGRLERYELKNYKKTSVDSHFLDLVDIPSEIASDAKSAPHLPLGVFFANQEDRGVVFKTVSIEGAVKNESGIYNLEADKDIKLVFEGEFIDGILLRKVYTFAPQSYLFNLDVELVEASPEDNKLEKYSKYPIWVEWTHFVDPENPNWRIDPMLFTALSPQSSIKKITLESLTSGKQDPPLAQRWLALGNKYFTSVMMPNSTEGSFAIGRNGNNFYTRVRNEPAQLKNYQAGFQIYLGPKDLDYMKGLGKGLEKTIDLGFFTFLADPLLRLLRLFYALLGNYGLAIILLTLFIKLLFYPLTKASFTSMKAMQDIQPEVKELRERVKDSALLNQEMMALYKRKGVNPLGGCLPIVIQIPVFLGLYSALQQSIELRHSPFALWITDLSAPEKLPLFGINFPVMIIMMGISMILQQWYTPSNMDEQQRKIMMFMPVVFTFMFIIFPMPSGLVLYWLVNNFISIVQQVYLRNTRGANPLTATLLASVGIFFIGYILTLL